MIGQLDGWKLTLQDVGSYLQDQRIFLTFLFFIQVNIMKKKVKEENFDLVLWYNLPGYIDLNLEDIEP